MTRHEQIADAYALLSSIATVLDRDAPILQALALLRIAMECDGMDQGALTEALKMSCAATSRTVQALSALHYS